MDHPSCETDPTGPTGHCTNCGAAIPEGAQRCPRCGATRTTADTSTDPAVIPTLDSRLQRWIPREWAQRLLATRGQVSRERRTVTILFCDVQGSTALSEGLDPEDVMEIMDGAFDVLIPPIYHYEGTLARLMGDAVLAFFGAPIAHEDDPERACRAALEIIDGVQDYATRLEQERGILGFNVRVGIHTGLVVVGEVGSDLRVEYTAMGDAVNLAQRLEHAAPPGTVLISAATYRLIEALFETQALEPQHIKGRTEPVMAYQVTAPRVVREKPRGVTGLDSPLVGREHEFAALMEAVERVSDGQGGIVTIVGEAGIGKSRLVAEVRRAVRESRPSPLQWIEGRCLSYSGNVAYQLWTNMLRNWLDLPSDAGPLAVREALEKWVQGLCPDRIEKSFPYLARMMALPLPEETEAALAGLDGQQIREATFGAVEACVESAAQAQPLVVVCEDIYWADTTSMALLEQLLPLTEQVPLLLICVFRPLKDHPSWRIREAAAQRHAERHTDLWLSALSEEQSQTLVHNLLETEVVPAPLRARILHVAEGNPFFVEEILRALIQQGTVAPDPTSAGWLIGDEAAVMAIPNTVNGVLNARIDRLPEDARRVLRTAAVIGRIFPQRVLAAVAKSDGDLDAHLRTLQRAEMIRQRAREPEAEYIFKHELTREAAYNGLLKKERRALHRHVAQATERLLPERVPEQLGLLAHHWEQAGDAEKAIDYLLRAGDQARLAYAQEEALRSFERALALAEEHGQQSQVARTWMKLGLTHHASGDFERARQAYDTGFDRWNEASKQPRAKAPPKAPHALRMDWFMGPASLDPAMWRDNYSAPILGHLFSPLARLTPELDLVPDVARGWEVRDGARRYVFHLRDDVRWSDGTPLTAHDYVFACQRVLDPELKAPCAVMFYDIRGARAFHQGEICDPQQIGVRALDNWTMEVELEGPATYFVYLANYFWPVPRHAVEELGSSWADAEHIVTCGAFALESWQPGHALVLARPPHYHGPFMGNLDRVVLHLIDDARVSLEMYEREKLDVLFPEVLDRTLVTRARMRHPTEDLSLPRVNTKYLGFDVRRPPFNDVRVRRAFALALDKAALSGAGACGFFPATGGFVPPGAPGHQAGTALPFDPARARQLLAEAGYPGGRGFPPVNLLYTTGLESFCVELQQQWQAHLNVHVDWETMDWPDYLARIRAGSERPNLYTIGSAPLTIDPDCMLRIGPFRQWTGWTHDRYDHIVEVARRSTDRNQRMALYAEAERILREEVPIIPLLHGLNMALVKPWVTRFPISPLRWPAWQDVILEPH